MCPELGQRTEQRLGLGALAAQQRHRHDKAPIAAVDAIGGIACTRSTVVIDTSTIGPSLNPLLWEQALLGDRAQDAIGPSSRKLLAPWA